MQEQPETAGVITPAQMAHLRAKLYAQRGVTNREASLLLEAYDDLVRRFTLAMEDTGLDGRTHAVVPPMAQISMQLS